jgi:hypothetical protein
MTTIMSFGNSEGTRSCDAKCHSAAPGSPCDCICEGRYHSTGAEAQRALQYDLEAGVWGDALKNTALTILGQAELGIVR